MATTKIEVSRQLKINADLNFNNRKITNLADPVSAQDAATKNYVDNMSIGLDVKRSVRCASTAQIATKSGLLTVDGITLLAGDRILLKDEADSRLNGIYVAASGAWTRASDFAAATHVGGSFVFVEEGTVNGDNGFVCTSNNGVSDLVDDIGSDIQFVQFSGAGQIIAGTGISKSGNTLSLATVGTAGTYTKVTTDAYGRVTAGTSLAATDLPTGIDALKIGGGLVDNTEFSYLNGVTSAIQTQLNAKEATLTKGNLTESTSSVLTITGGTGAVIGAGLSIQVKVATSTVSGYLATADWNTFNNKQAAITGAATTITATNLTISKALISDASGKVAVSTVSSTELGYVSGVTSPIQTQLNAKLTTANYVVREIPGGLMNGSNTAFTLAHAPSAGDEMVFLNGVLQNAGAGNDYTITGATITMLTAPLADDLILVTYIY